MRVILILILIWVFFTNITNCRIHEQTVSFEANSKGIFAINNTNKRIKLFIPRFFNDMYLDICMVDSNFQNILGYTPRLNRGRYDKLISKRKYHFSIPPYSKKKIDTKFMFDRRLNKDYRGQVRIWFRYEFPYDDQLLDSTILEQINKSHLELVNPFLSDTFLLNFKDVERFW